MARTQMAIDCFWGKLVSPLLHNRVHNKTKLPAKNDNVHKILRQGPILALDWFCLNYDIFKALIYNNSAKKQVTLAKHLMCNVDINILTMFMAEYHYMYYQFQSELKHATWTEHPLFLEMNSYLQLLETLMGSG